MPGILEKDPPAFRRRFLMARTRMRKPRFFSGMDAVFGACAHSSPARPGHSCRPRAFQIILTSRHLGHPGGKR